MKEPEWPSVEEQLVAAKVVHGSALEQLIRDNQDFHLLRPEEANDTIGLPLWLRVYWRKNHPDEQYSTDDPAGGYPDVLNNVYTWMVLHQDLPWGSPNESVGPETPSAPTGQERTGKDDARGGTR